MNDLARTRKLIDDLEMSRRWITFLWNTNAPLNRFDKPLKEATKTFNALRDCVVFEHEDMERLKGLQMFFDGVKRKLQEQIEKVQR